MNGKPYLDTAPTAARQLLDAATAEADFQATVRHLAGAAGWLTYHTYDSRRSNGGFPDLVLVKGRRVVFAELKTEKGRVRPDQACWLDALADAETVEAYLWRPSDWDAITTILADRQEVPA